MGGKSHWHWVDFIQDKSLKPSGNFVGFQFQHTPISDFRKPNMFFILIVSGIVEDISPIRGVACLRSPYGDFRT
jgi:hypothetical protein